MWGSTLILSQVQDSHLVEVVLSQVSLHFINRVLCNSFQDNFTKLHCKWKLPECSLPQYVLYAITTIYHTYSLFIERRVEQIINLSATSSVGQIHSAFNRPLKLSLPLWSTYQEQTQNWLDVTTFLTKAKRNSDVFFYFIKRQMCLL